MAFKQSLGIEVIVQGGCIGAFQRSKMKLAVGAAITLVKEEHKPIALIFPVDENREDRNVAVQVYYESNGIVPFVEVKDIEYGNYEEAWIGTQQQLRQVSKTV